MRLRYSFLLIKIICISLIWVTSSADGTPTIQFDTLSFSFNTVALNQKLVYTFKFKNIGSGDLTIRDIKTSCDCAAAAVGMKSIPHNRYGEILVTLSTGSTTGEKKENIFVYSNDSAHSPVELTVSAFVRSAISITPSQLDFPDLRYGQGTSQIVIIKFPKEENLKISSITTLSPFLSARILPDKSRSPDKILVSVNISSTWNIGKFTGALRFYTNSSTFPMLRLAVSGEIKGTINITPDRIFFGLAKRGGKITRSILMTNSGKGIFSITKIDSSVKGLSFQIETIRKGKQYKINAILDTTLAEKQISDKVVLHTDLSEQSSFELPVFAYLQ